MLVMWWLVGLIAIAVARSQDWTAVRRHRKIDWDLQLNPLLIRTNSALGSGEEIYLSFYDKQYFLAGGLIISFENPIKYSVTDCTGYITHPGKFPTAPPAEQDKVWAILRTDRALKVECNGVLVLHYNITRCSSYRDYWEREVKKVRFSSYDTASDETTATTDWTAVPKGKIIDFDLQQNPLQIRTNSVVGRTLASSDTMWLWFYTEDGWIESKIGGLSIAFTNPMQYWIPYCTSFYYFNFPTAPPAEQDKVWTILRTDTALKVECNGVLVLHYNMSQCSHQYLWKYEVNQIMFSIDDTASDEYIAPECEAGQYMRSYKIACAPCPANTYSRADSTFWGCTDCPEGSVTNTNKTGCEKCPARQYRNENVTDCTTCPENTISDQAGTASCTPCVPGTVANTDKTQCECTVPKTHHGDFQLQYDKTPVKELLHDGANAFIKCDEGYMPLDHHEEFICNVSDPNPVYPSCVLASRDMKDTDTSYDQTQDENSATLSTTLTALLYLIFTIPVFVL